MDKLSTLRLIAVVFKSAQKCKRHFIVLKHFFRRAQKSCLRFVSRWKMFSELILLGEPFDRDNTAMPFAENHPFGFAKWRSLWWRLCGHRGQKHCSVQLSLCFLGPSSNTQSFLGVWAGSVVPRTLQYHLHRCLSSVLKLLENTVAWSYAEGSGVC